jgi:hypothetical protein
MLKNILLSDSISVAEPHHFDAASYPLWNGFSSGYGSVIVQNSKIIHFHLAPAPVRGLWTGSATEA